MFFVYEIKTAISLRKYIMKGETKEEVEIALLESTVSEDVMIGRLERKNQYD